jgi:hypothetical protein
MSKVARVAKRILYTGGIAAGIYHFMFPGRKVKVMDMDLPASIPLGLISGASGTVGDVAGRWVGDKVFNSDDAAISMSALAGAAAAGVSFAVGINTLVSSNATSEFGGDVMAMAYGAGVSAGSSYVLDKFIAPLWEGDSDYYE